MISRFIMVMGLVTFSGAVFGQEAAYPPAIGYKDTHQTDYLDIRGTVNFTNAGFYPLPARDICVNAYVFAPTATSPDGEAGARLTACCSCRVAPNALGSFTPVFSGPIVVKLVSTLPTRVGAPCDPTQVPNAPPGTPGGHATGMRAWSISQPTVLSEQLSTSPFVPIPLGDTQQAKLAQGCAMIPTRCLCQ